MSSQTLFEKSLVCHQLKDAKSKKCAIITDCSALAHEKIIKNVSLSFKLSY